MKIDNSDNEMIVRLIESGAIKPLSSPKGNIVDLAILRELANEDYSVEDIMSLIKEKC